MKKVFSAQHNISTLVTRSFRKTLQTFVDCLMMYRLRGQPDVYTHQKDYIVKLTPILTFAIRTESSFNDHDPRDVW